MKLCHRSSVFVLLLTIGLTSIAQEHVFEPIDQFAFIELYNEKDNSKSTKCVLLQVLADAIWTEQKISKEDAKKIAVSTYENQKTFRFKKKSTQKILNHLQVTKEIADSVRLGEFYKDFVNQKRELLPAVERYLSNPNTDDYILLSDHNIFPDGNIIVIPLNIINGFQSFAGALVVDGLTTYYRHQPALVIKLSEFIEVYGDFSN